MYIGYEPPKNGACVPTNAARPTSAAPLTARRWRPPLGHHPGGVLQMYWTRNHPQNGNPSQCGTANVSCPTYSKTVAPSTSGTTVEERCNVSGYETTRKTARAFPTSVTRPTPPAPLTRQRRPPPRAPPWRSAARIWIRTTPQTARACPTHRTATVTCQGGLVHDLPNTRHHPGGVLLCSWHHLQHVRRFSNNLSSTQLSKVDQHTGLHRPGLLHVRV